MKEAANVLQDVLGYRFRNRRLLTKALTHSTFAYESQQDDVAGNQRLEFLGDSILGMVVAEYLFQEHTSSYEGELTRKRSLLVNRNHLAKKTKEMGLAEFLLLGKGEERTNGRSNPTNLAGALEAVIGAIYIDGGLKAAKKFILHKII